MTSDHSNITESSLNCNMRSLKSSIRKTLVVRLFIAGSVISIVLALTVFSLEFQRLSQLVNNRAGEIVARFNDEIRDNVGNTGVHENT